MLTPTLTWVHQDTLKDSLLYCDQTYARSSFEKTMADSTYRIMLRLERNCGKKIMRQAKFTDEYNATTACTLRLCKPWFGTSRLICEDSWFMQCVCAIALEAVHFGLPAG